ncbi:MAG: hypothetical protein ABI307_13530 [Mycobacterium sp.]
MTFVLTQRVTTVPGAAVRDAGQWVASWLRRLGAPTRMTPQQRVERYVSRMPIAVLAG